MGRKKNKNKKTPPTKLLKEQALFAIKTSDLDTSIQEQDSTECPGAKSYASVINTTTDIVTTTTTNDKEDNDLGKLTTLGDTGNKTSEWTVKENRKKKGNNNHATSSWIQRTALNPAISPTSKLPPTPTVASTTTIMTNSVADLKPAIHKLI